MQGVLKALNVNKLTKCGVTFKFWVADWFAQLNNKMGGDLKKIQVGKGVLCLRTAGIYDVAFTVRRILCCHIPARLPRPAHAARLPTCAQLRVHLHSTLLPRGFFPCLILCEGQGRRPRHSKPPAPATGPACRRNPRAAGFQTRGTSTLAAA